MLNQRTRWLDNIDSPTVYSPEQYRQLRYIPGTQDRAQARQKLSEKELQHLCTRLAVGDDVANEATSLYQQVIRTNMVNNRLNGTLIATSVYTACRKYELPRTSHDVDDAAQVLVHSDRDLTKLRTYNGHEIRDLTFWLGIQRTYNKICDRFGRHYPPVAPEKFAQRYCDELELGTEVEEFVRVAITQVDGEAMAGRDPKNIAAGAIYYASEKMDLGIRQRDIAVVAHCNVSTIRDVRTLIKESIEPE